MPLFSAFTPFGMLAFSGKPSHAENIYRAQVANLEQAYDLTQGTHEEATVYARSMAIARTQYTIDRAGNQSNVLKAHDNLPNLEKDYEAIPGLLDTTHTRRQALAVKKTLTRGAVRENIIASLSALLGSRFIALRTVTTSEAVVWPSGSPRGACGRPDLPAKTAVLVDAMVSFAIGYSVRYTNLDPAAPEVVFAPGDILTIQPENQGLTETKTVASAGGVAGARFITFPSELSNPHDVGAVLTTAPQPNWISTQRYMLVILTAAAAIDSEARRLVDDVMERLVRATDRWAIVSPSLLNADGKSGTVGPFKVGQSPLGATTLGTIAFP